MKISVITACFNAEQTIRDTIESVAAQTYTRREHIVVDGRSVDSTMEIIKRYEDKFSTVISEPDDGVYDAMNKGIARAAGDVVGFLNADDVYAHTGVLARVAQVMRNSDVDACYADLVYVNRKNDRIVRYWKSRPYRPGLFESGWMPAHPTFYVRKAVYERLGGFDLAYPRQADFDLTMRFIAVNGIRTAYVPEIWVRMRAGGISNRSWQGVLKGNFEAYLAARRSGLNVPPWFMLVKVISRLPQYWSARKLT